MGYGSYMQIKQYLKTITHDQIVQYKLEIIKFSYEYGVRATVDVYIFGGRDTRSLAIKD